MFLADTVNEEFHMAAPGTDIHVKAFAFHEPFAELSEDSPVRSLMETSCPGVLELLIAAKA